MSDMIWRRYLPTRNADVWFNAQDEEVGVGSKPPAGWSCQNAVTVAYKDEVVAPDVPAAIATVTLTAPGLTLPTDSAARKEIPMFEGCVAYFPAALAGVARVSKLGNDKHNPGEPLHHARGKSMDHSDCVLRHLVDLKDLLAIIERGTPLDMRPQLLHEADQMAWRALALSQGLHEVFGGAPLAPNARVS